MTDVDAFCLLFILGELFGVEVPIILIGAAAASLAGAEFREPHSDATVGTHSPELQSCRYMAIDYAREAA